MWLDLCSLTMLVVLVASLVGVDSDLFSQAPLSFCLSSITMHPLIKSMWKESEGDGLHIEEGEWFDLLAKILVSRSYLTKAEDTEMPTLVVSEFG